MTALKTYTLGINGMPRTEVVAALGLERWVRQVEITVADRSKKAAHALLETRRLFIPLGDAEFRVTDAGFVRALRDAGLLDQPEVLASPLTHHQGAPVVRILPGGLPERLGVLREVDRSWVFIADSTGGDLNA